jgi:hypothetical protein
MQLARFEPSGERSGSFLPLLQVLGLHLGQFFFSGGAPISEIPVALPDVEAEIAGTIRREVLQ